MVVGICAKDADVIEVLVAVGWWWVLVCAELVASTEDARVKETGLGFIVVTELCRTCSSRTMGYPSHFLGGVGGCVDLVRGVCVRWLSCWSWAWLRCVKCGGASVRRFLSMELRVGLGWPDDVDGSAGEGFVAVCPPRLQGFEVGAVASMLLLVGGCGRRPGRSGWGFVIR